jgi:polysaccharide export outer membrane protein
MNNTFRTTMLIRRFARIMLIWIGVVPFLAACASSSQPTAKLQDVMQKESVQNEQNKQFNEKIFASASSAPDMADYVLGEGDLLNVSVFEAQELKTEARVSSSGAVTLQLLGSVEVRGLTVRAAERKLEEMYRQKYLQNPHVTVFVKEQQGGKITLLGALNKPGTFDYFARQRLLDVLALGGGLSDKAGRSIQVRRAGNDPANPNTVVIDLDELIKQGHSELNITINRGDVVFVPEAGTVYVDGAVRMPGNYPIKKTMTAQEVIVAAGGFANIADAGNIKLVRYTGEGTREIVQLSAKSSALGGDSAGSVNVKDRDVLYVERDGLKTFVYSIRFTVGNGLLGVGWSPPAESSYNRPAGQ